MVLAGSAWLPRILVPTLLFLFACTPPSGRGVEREEAPRDHKKTVPLLAPILTSRALAIAHPDDDVVAEAVGVPLARLLEDNSAEADQAVVMLLDYYLGEAYDEDVLHNVTLRGRRALPHLLRFSTQRPSLEGIDPPESIILSKDERDRRFTVAIEHVKSGRVWGSD
jgi:hypothetical protein